MNIKDSWEVCVLGGSIFQPKTKAWFKKRFVTGVNGNSDALSAISLSGLRNLSPRVAGKKIIYLESWFNWHKGFRDFAAGINFARDALGFLPRWFLGLEISFHFASILLCDVFSFRVVIFEAVLFFEWNVRNSSSRLMKNVEFSSSHLYLVVLLFSVS